MTKDFRVGDVLSKSFSTFFSNFIPFCLITLIISLPMLLYSYSVFASVQEMAGPGYMEHGRTRVPAGAAGSTILLGVLSLLSTYIATGAVTYGVFQQLRGVPPTIGKCMAVGFGRMFPIIGVAILAGLFVIAGFFLLVIPGIMFMTWIYVAIPVAVVEKPGVLASLRRSRELTKGYRWRVLGLMIVIGVLNWLATFLVEMILPGGAASWMVKQAFAVVLGAIASTTTCVSYYQLRSVKETVGIDEIARVFD